jgi:hypothetical protein
MSDHPSDLRTIAEGFAASGDSHIAEKLRGAADEIERLQTLLSDCRAGFDRLARQVDGYTRAGKKSDGWRKKT